MLRTQRFMLMIRNLEKDVKRRRLNDRLLLVRQLLEWLERGFQDSYIGVCSLGTTTETIHLSEEQILESRCVEGESLNQCWGNLSQTRIMGESTSLCLPNPPPEFSIEDHLGK